VVLVLLLEIYDRLREAWVALVKQWEPQRPAVRDETAPQPRRRAF
jgi:hypothetical protein